MLFEKKFKYAKIATIRKPHGLHGEVSVELAVGIEMYGLSIQTLLTHPSCCLINEFYELIQNVNIEKVFGIVKNTAKIKLKEFNQRNDVENYRGKILAIQKNIDEFILDDLIDLKIKDKGKIIAKILAIHDFGAGIVLDTNFEMLRIEDLDLTSIHDGFINLI